MRQVVLDTETTGLEVSQGHRVIEIGCVEIQNRRLTGRHFHRYIDPQRDVDPGAVEVHGITNEFLADKPLFSAVSSDFLEFVVGAELIIHNAPFDIGFLDHELRTLDAEFSGLAQHCEVTDTLLMARDKHPGQRNSLDALCQRYSVDNSNRELHGALLDAEILAEVYLVMTGGQTLLALGSEDQTGGSGKRRSAQRQSIQRSGRLKVIIASEAEQEAHQSILAEMEKSGTQPLYQQS
ncbi:MAG: DNA polymerase III subunit epsilon [Pseudomonadota bacterium]